MPQGESGEQIHKRFEVVGSSKTILIGRDGKVPLEDDSPSDPRFVEVLDNALAAKSVAR